MISSEAKSVTELNLERSDVYDGLRKEGSCAEACLQGGGGEGGEGGRAGEERGGRDEM